MRWLPLVLLLVLRAGRADWGAVHGGRLAHPTCTDIPENLTLCHGIGYRKMRLPNLLDHDSMAEVSQQAVSWVPLFNLKCHPDTQLFLCSLFSPVCLDRPIYPCRSLCDAVRQGCEGRMRTYGFPWPDMVRCDKFPVDNDMCISVQSISRTESAPCTACNQAETYENIIDNYCRADFVLRTRVRHIKNRSLMCKKARIIKAREGMPKKELRRPVFQHTNLTDCCRQITRNTGKKGRFLIMGVKATDGLALTFIMEWKKTAIFRKAVRMMKKIDCANPKILSETMLADGLMRKTPPLDQRNRRSRGRRPMTSTEPVAAPPSTRPHRT